MKQVLIQGGRAVVREMPAPRCGDGEVLVRAAYSLISTGTEMAHLAASSDVPPGRWSRRARKIGEVVRLAIERGPAAATVVRDRMEGPCEVTGYSLAGTIVRVGAGVTDLVPGQRVACAGDSAAHHAEIVAVPRNLVVAVPENLPLERAAFVTLGAIALQGVRTADLRLGETVCVIGLGLVGQLAVALLGASGCRVFGIDLAPERVLAARSLGLEAGFVAESGDDPERRIDDLTAGRGVDAVLLTASTPSSEPIRRALRVVRSRGRVVVVGAVGMEVDRSALYAKDAEIRISRSYGPGRYDPCYEDRGIDYPYDYVRWTENRNMQEFLRLAAAGEIRLESLAGYAVPVTEAGDAFRSLSEGPVDERPLAVVLSYPGVDDRPPSPRIVVAPPPLRASTLGVALVGPGAFASGVHLPNLAALGRAARLRAVVGRTANPAREIARRWSAEYAATDFDEVLRDPEVDLVLICTRHDLHADQAVRALEAGKAVFLEKPAAIDAAGLDRLESAASRASCPLVVGFNRRCAPDVRELRSLLSTRCGPLVASYRVNAGRLPSGHWALGPQGGGRLIGEACHMIDVLRYLVGRPSVDHRLQLVAAQGRDDLPRGDNFVLSSRYADGSVTELTYTSLGHPGAGKERLEVHWDGRTAVIDDFRGLRLCGVAAAAPPRPEPDKGHRELLRAFVDHVLGRGPEPIPWDEVVEVTRLTIELDRMARGGDDPFPLEG